MILHEWPFRFVGDVKNENPLEVWAAFPIDSPYIDEVVARPLVVEAMAQAVGVFAGREAGQARAGVLAMIKKAVFLGDVRRDARVFLRVTPGRNFGRLRVFHAEAHGDRMLASAEVVVAST